MNKKLLLGLGAIGAVTAPIATVISCNNDDEGSKYGKDMQSLVDAFNPKTKGGKDISAQFQEIKEGIIAIEKLPKDKQDAALDEILKQMIPVIAKAEYDGSANHVSYTTLLDDVDAFKDGILDNINGVLNNITDEKQAEKYGIKLADVANAKLVTAKLDAADFGTADDANAITIGEQLDKVSKQVIEPMYVKFKSDISIPYAELSKEFKLIKDATDEKEMKTLVLKVSEILFNMEDLHTSGPVNTFVSSTKVETITDWNNMFKNIGIIASSFDNAKAAIAYGFDSYEEAQAAGQQAEKLSKISKNPDATKDPNSITIDAKPSSLKGDNKKGEDKSPEVVNKTSENGNEVTTDKKTPETTTGIKPATTDNSSKDTSPETANKATADDKTSGGDDISKTKNVKSTTTDPIVNNNNN